MATVEQQQQTGIDPRPLLEPRSIAVVGASDRPSSYGDLICGNLERAGFPGPVWGVNPSRAGTEVHGFECLPTLEDLPEPVDAVVIAVPAAGVPETIERAGALGCRGAIVISAGFGEVASGRALEAELKDVALRYRMPVCGPNGNGVAAIRAHAPMWGDAVGRVLPGRVAMISQSGNVGVNALGSGRGIDFHTVISTGNQAVIDASDWLAALARSRGVGSVALFLEAAGDGEKLAGALADCVEREIGVVIQKVGSSEAGTRAAAAHTGSLAGDHRAFRALVEEAGAGWAEEPHELLELARAMAAPKARPAPGDPPGLAVLTCSGGDSGCAADLAEKLGVPIPMLSERSRGLLAEFVPSAVTIDNPLDYTSMLWGDREALRKMITILSEDESIGQVLVLFDYPNRQLDTSWGDVLDGVIAGAADAASAVMVAATLPDLIDENAIRRLERHGVPMIAGLGEGIRAAKALGRESVSPPRLREIAAAAATARDAVPRGGGEIWLDEAEAKRLLAEAGVPVPPGGVVADADAAVERAAALGGPVALKLVAPGLLHKSELGALRLGLESEEELREAARELLALPEAAAGRLLVEGMAEPPGAELMIAARADSIVPTVMVGLGGIWAEALDDVALVPLPAGGDAIEAAIRSLRGAGMLTGARGRAPLDIAAVAGLASRVGGLLLAEGLQLIELNPVFVYERGALAVDAVIGR